MKNVTFHPQQASTAYNSSGRGGFIRSSLVSDGILMGPVLCMPYVGNHCFCEFIGETAISYPTDSASQPSFPY